jgi:integrase
MGSVTFENITRTATVIVRHATDCPSKKEGAEWRKCTCRKSLLLYDGATQKQTRVSAKTRNWSVAEDKAQQWLDQFDPLKLEIKRLKAEKEVKTVSIEQAVAAYIANKIFELGDNGTVSRTRTLLGDVDPATFEVKRDGKLFDWLTKQMPRPLFISDITPDHLTSWRNSWGYGSDMTASVSWTDAKGFFKFCKAQGWISANPAADLKRPKVQKGNRTAPFSDKQYDSILAAAKGDHRLEAFLELLRWSGMALIDAVQFDPKTLDDDGVLRYKRAKTGVLATVPIPAHVSTLLRGVPLGECKADQPFRRPGVTIASAIHEWRRELQRIFKQAGITEVQTEVGKRPAHPHMLRDTCAVWYLRHGVKLHGVSKILGHSNPTITARAYLPFVKELETAHIDEVQQVLEAAKPRQAGRKVVNISGDSEKTA